MKEATKQLSGLLAQYSKGDIDHLILGSKYTALLKGVPRTEDQDALISRACSLSAAQLKTDLSDPYLKNIKGRASIAFYSLTSYDGSVKLTDGEKADKQLRIIKLYEPFVKEFQKLIIKNYHPGKIVMDSTVGPSGKMEEPSAQSKILTERKQQSALRDSESLLIPVFQEKMSFIEKSQQKKPLYSLTL